MGEPEITPIHKWTHDGKEVLLVKCVDADGVSRGKNRKDFLWPISGPVETPASRKPDCESGGLFGWPWGLNIGGGKDPDYNGRWIVFSAPPENVINLYDKVKVVPKEGDTIAHATVLFCGSWFEALLYCALGREAWIIQNARGSAANSGDRGSTANSGVRGSAANSGDYGSAANSGDQGSAANSGVQGSAANSGFQGSAANSGDYGSAANSGVRGSAANSGFQGSAANSGDRGSAANSGDRGSAANSGVRGSAANSGFQGSAVNSGDQGASIATGDNSAASATICAYAGLHGRVRGKIGGALVLAFETKDKKIVAKAVVIDGKKIKPSVWYSLNKLGKFAVAEDQTKIFGEPDVEKKA